MANVEDRLIEQQDDEQAYDTSEPTEVNKAKKRASRTRADRLQFVGAAMTTPQGRAWYYDMLVRCKVINTPFSEDPYRTAFNCGQQNIGLQILSDIQDSAPNEYVKMITENHGK
jgi:hypothetical protein